MSYYNFQKQTNLFEQPSDPPIDKSWDKTARRFMGVIQTTSKELTVDLPNLTITNNETGQVKPIIVRYNKDGTIAGPSLNNYYAFNNGTIVQFKPVVVDGQKQPGQIALDVNNNQTIPIVTGWVAHTPPETFDWTWFADLFGGGLLGNAAGDGGAVEDIIDTGTNPSDDGGIIDGPLVHGGPGDDQDSGSG